jgi:hypothetical protein
MRDIETCRTALMGGHVDVCENECGHFAISYNSCRNRHCPKCQGLRGLQWLEQRLERLLPTHYFHMVATLPHEINPIVLCNKELLYNMLFRAVSRALLEYALTWERLQARIGFTAVLHTWDQELSMHPHLHIIATGGGLDAQAKRWVRSRLNFLVPVKALSIKIRDTFCQALQEAFDQGRLTFPLSLAHLSTPDAFRRFLRKRRRQKWVVYCKKPFGGPEQFLSYIGRYTHRVAISNSRILDFSDGHVTFKARDNHNPGKHRTVILPPQEFIRRFLLHILPSGFVKIRHYGLMAPGNAKDKFELAKALLHQHADSAATVAACASEEPHTAPPTWRERLKLLTGIDLTVCPRCGARLIRKPFSSLSALLIHEEAAAVNSS